MEHTNVYLSIDAFAVLAAAAGYDVYEVLNGEVIAYDTMFVGKTFDKRVYVASKSPSIELRPIDPSKPIVLQLYHKADKEELE